MSPHRWQRAAEVVGADVQRLQAREVSVLAPGVGQRPRQLVVAQSNSAEVSEDPCAGTSGSDERTYDTSNSW